MLRRPRREMSRAGVVGVGVAHRLGAVDADHVGAHVGEQHRRERAWPDAGDLDDAVAVQWSRHGSSLQFDAAAAAAAAWWCG